MPHALRPDPLTPHPARLAPDDPWRDRVLAAHRGAIAQGRDGYADPRTGYTVLTAAFLAARGSCCGSGCRHCPYLELG